MRVPLFIACFNDAMFPGTGRAVLTGKDAVALCAERVADYRATVARTVQAGLPDAIATALTAWGAEHLALPSGFPLNCYRPAPGIGTRNHWTSRALGGVITLAATGTIVLDTGLGQGRRSLTLVRDYHPCIIRAEQIADDVPDALARLTPMLPLTFLPGPSATSDIELDRVEGVHGPRTPDVIIIDPEHPE